MASSERPQRPLLTEELAQRVVDQVRPVMEHNVNIMDARGVIIASADTARLGTTHDGAITALERGDVVRIEFDQAQSATRAGVNVPLVIDGNAVGVVGVTGRPGEVEPLARVLVLTVMLLIRQEQQLADSQWRESTLRDLLTALIRDPVISEARISAALRDAGVPITPPWNLLVAFDTAAAEAPSARLRNSVVGLDNVVGIERAGVMWFLLGRANGSTRAAMLDRLRSRGATVVVGRSSTSADELAIDARRLDIVTRAGGPRDGAAHDLAEFDLEVLIGRQAPELSADSVARSLGPLSDALRRTAAVVLEHNLSVVASAAALHTHRNTVVQRLERIQKLTGLDLRTFDDAVTMKIALAAAAKLQVDIPDSA